MLALILTVAAPALAIDVPYSQDFETDVAALADEGWSVERAAVVAENPRSGEQCLRVESKTGKPTYAHLFIPVAAGRFYAADVSARCEGVEAHALGGENRGAVIFLQWANAEKGWVGGGTFPKGLLGDSDWTQREVEYTREISGDVAYVQLMLGVEGKGAAWFDDVRVYEVTEWGGTEPVTPADAEVVDVRRPLLTWTLPGPRMVEAEIRVSRSEDVTAGDAIVLRGQGGQVRTEPLEPGTWHWRVQALSRNAKLPPGPVHTFTVADDAPVWPPDIRPTWTWSAASRPTLTAEITPRGIAGELRVTIDGDIAADVTRSADGAVSFRPAVDLAPGIHEVSIRLRGAGGRIAEETALFSSKQPGSRVEMRDDNMLLVDGEPFFPIGAYRDPSDSVDEFDALVEAGFNVTHNYRFESEAKYTIDDARAYLRAADAAGLKVFMGIRRSLVQAGDLHRIQQWVAALMDEPALLTWYLMDEPVLHSVSAGSMARTTDAVRVVDPVHPTSQVLCRPDSFGDYAASCDILWNDPYPLPNQPLTMVDEWVRGGREAALDRPYWTVLQGHDVRYWHEYEQAVEELGPVALPTYTDTRCMAFTALCGGANGLIWYWLPNSAYHIQRDAPNVWGGIEATVRELNDLMPYLVAERTDADDVAVPDPLRAWSRAANGKRVLIVVNPTEETVRCEVDLPEFGRDGTIYLFNADGIIEADGDGPLACTLTPHEVEIYEWRVQR